MLADVREPFLHDPEDLDLLVGREPDRAVDLELDLEPAVGGQDVDVAAQRRVERRGPARRREREDREPRLLLREQRGLLQARHRFVDRRAVLEHRRVRRDREEILREAVVDLARDACTLLGDSASELGELDRAPRADEDDDVREHAQEVALRHVRACEQRLEDEVQRGEQHQREAEREPAREVVAAAHEARAPADDATRQTNACSASVPVR